VDHRNGNEFGDAVVALPLTQLQRRQEGFVHARIPVCIYSASVGDAVVIEPCDATAVLCADEPQRSIAQPLLLHTMSPRIFSVQPRSGNRERRLQELVSERVAVMHHRRVGLERTLKYIILYYLSLLFYNSFY
jgi:hypothetical protein